MCTINNTRNRSSFGPDGCQVPVGKGICGETKTLDIINEFKRLYEEKMHEIDHTGGGDCLQEKIKLQQEWIGDLTEQNEMLVRAVGELEHEATERVHILEEKLQQSAKCICEGENIIKQKEGIIAEIKDKINYYNQFGDVECLARDLKCKNEECESLKQSMEDMRHALTEEVASKHDVILQLKRDCQQLEDRCIQADKQVAFKDDIIKELRKEIKQLKQQVSLPEKPFKTVPTSDKSYESVRRNSSGEPYLVINHTRKIVQSGKSTVIYLRKDSGENVKEITPKKYDTVYDKHTNTCWKCKEKLEREVDMKQEIKSNIASSTRSGQANFDEKTLHFCKSENDLCEFRKNLRPINERTTLTSNHLTRHNTFVGCTSQVFNNTDSEHSRLKQRNLYVPNHIPVKMIVNNLEYNKKY